MERVRGKIRKSTLSDLVKKNQQRWKIIEGLHQELQEISNLCEERNKAKKSNDTNDTNDKNDKNESHLDKELLYFQSEVETLRSNHPDNDITSGENHFEIGLKDVENRHLEVFGDEISSTFDGLVKVNEVMDKQLGKSKNEKRNNCNNLHDEIREMKEIEEKHNELHKTLNFILKEKKEENDKIPTKRKVTEDIYNEIEKKSKDYDWIKGEIIYLSKLIHWNPNNESGTSSKLVLEGPCTKETNKYHPKQNTFLPKESTGTTISCKNDKTWDLSRLLEKMIRKMLASDLDPYIEHDQFISMDMVDFLVSCQVAEYHPNNKKFFKINNLIA